MNKRIILVATISFMVVGLTLAGPEHEGKHKSELKSLSSNTPEKKTATAVISKGSSTQKSAIPELAGIVVLCATDEKKKFEKEWSKYVEYHDLKGEKLQEAIAEVSNQAEAMRAEQNLTSSDPAVEKAWMEERREFMNEVARRAFSPAL